ADTGAEMGSCDRAAGGSGFEDADRPQRSFAGRYQSAVGLHKVNVSGQAAGSHLALQRIEVALDHRPDVRVQHCRAGALELLDLRNYVARLRVRKVGEVLCD